MTQAMIDFINEVNLSDVSQTIVADLICISFTLHDQDFYLLMNKSKDSTLFYPYTIGHYSGERCLACKEENQEQLACFTLTMNIDVLFQRLIEQPSIRLEWLYIPHANEPHGTGR